jgi:hypothetical protein
MPPIDKNEEIIYVIDGSDVDGKYKRGDDLKEEIIETLATFLHCLSKEEKNKFTISPGVEMKSTRTPSGDPAPLDDNLNGSENPYAPTSQNPQLRALSDSGQIFTPTIGSFLTKGKADTFLRDIEDGLTETSGQTGTAQGEGPIFDAIRSALDNNRFSPGANGAFVNRGAAPNVLGKTQAEFGRHNKDGKDIVLEDLQKIGFSLMFRAAREIKAVQEGDPLEAPESFAVGLGALIPGAAQISLLKADTNNLRASVVMEENFGLPQKPRTDSEPQINVNNKSWGHLNTPLEPYSGFLPIGMTGLALVMTVAIRVIAFAFIGFLALIVKEKTGKIPNRGPFILGQYGKPNPSNNKLFNLAAIGIITTERDFLTVVNEGLDLFFSFDGASFRRVIREPQFFAIFVRNIIRSGNIIVNSVADVFSSGQNPLAAAQAFLGLIDVLKSSKIVAFLNIMAQMGDRAAEARDQGFDPQDSKKSSLENLKINPATNIMRIRNGRSDLKSGISNGSTMSMFLFPPEIIRAADIAGGTTNAKKALASIPGAQIANSKDVDSNGRITAEKVAEIEAELDSEYVPFYFHDLRTNEIISFHAFLDSLQDNYAPQYESATAYGRIDNVRTYISTERTLSLSFKIAAMSKEDFDFMWWKINKLTTLVYPSWTQGRQVASGADKFIQPFSQVPASTPVIRLRIGDLIRSNFSKTGLSRLFGAGLGEDQFGEDQFNLTQSKYKDSDIDILKEQINAFRNRMNTNPAITGRLADGYSMGETAILLPKRTGYPLMPDKLPAGQRVKALFQQKQKQKLVVTASTKVKIAGNVIIEDYGEHSVAYYPIEVEGATNESEGKFIVTFDDLVTDPDQIQKSSSAFLPFGVQDIDLVTTPDIFSSNENAIVRSFETTQGKGLGGVITSLSFTELAAPSTIWETSEYGSRAPKMITCNIEFAVIHDIAPGIDDKGFNRGLQYSVGNAARHLMGDNVVSDFAQSEEKFNKNHRDAADSLIRNPKDKKGFPGGL